MFGPDVRSFIKRLDKKIETKVKDLELVRDNDFMQSAFTLTILRQLLAEVHYEETMEDADAEANTTVKAEDQDQAQDQA